MPQPTRPTPGQTPSTPNPVLTSASDISSQPYGRTRTASGSQAHDDGPGSATSEVVDHAKETISNVASQAGEKVTAQLDTQRDRAASDLGNVARALRQTSDQIRDQNDAGLPVHQYVASAADQIDRFSGYLRSTDVRQMMGDVEQFARRQPGLFLGGAFVLGLIGARFLKSSGDNAMTGQRSIARGYELARRDDYMDRRPYDSQQIANLAPQTSATIVPTSTAGKRTGEF